MSSVDNDLGYVVRIYQVPAEIGGIVLFRGQRGEIVGAKNGYLRIRIGGEIKFCHPTWEMEYLFKKKEPAMKGRENNG